jgi:hypothetical protein
MRTIQQHALIKKKLLQQLCQAMEDLMVNVYVLLQFVENMEESEF